MSESTDNTYGTAVVDRPITKSGDRIDSSSSFVLHMSNMDDVKFLSRSGDT